MADKSEFDPAADALAAAKLEALLERLQAAAEALPSPGPDNSGASGAALALSQAAGLSPTVAHLPDVPMQRMPGGVASPPGATQTPLHNLPVVGAPVTPPGGLPPGAHGPVPMQQMAGGTWSPPGATPTAVPPIPTPGLIPVNTAQMLAPPTATPVPPSGPSWQQTMAKAGATLGSWGGSMQEAGDIAGKVGMKDSSAKMGEAANLMQTGARAMAGDPIAIAELAKKAADEMKERVSALGDAAVGMGQSTFKAMHSDKAEVVGAEMFSGGEKAAAGVGRAFRGTGIDIVAEQAEKVMGFGRQVMEALGALRGWTNALNENNLKFAEFSSSMARVQAMTEVNEIRLSQERGERRATSAEALATATNQLDRKLAPMEDAWANFSNVIAATLTTALARLLPQFGPEKNASMGGLAGDMLLEGGQLDTVRARSWYERFGDEPRQQQMR